MLFVASLSILAVAILLVVSLTLPLMQSETIFQAFQIHMVVHTDIV